MSSGSQIFFVLWLILGALYLTHLGVIPVQATGDECRRALVPLEMRISGDYLKPTINGELYLNKPPLYNWLVAGFYSVDGGYSPFALRLPVVLSILVHGLLIFWVCRRYTSEMVAGLSALALMTNWRTLTLDSITGLLEHTLALVIYAGFMVIFILGEKKKYLLLFIISYALAAIGFLIKGLPAIAHQGIALILYFLFSKNIGRLFSWQHLLGLVIFLIIVASCYVPFLWHNHIPFDQMASRLFSESAKRYGFSGARHLLHVLVDFPKDVIKHFLPWTLLLVFLFQKNIIRRIQENRFVTFNALLFIANIPIYWLASMKNPHYLYFLLPLLFTVLLYCSEQVKGTDWRYQVFRILALAFLVIGLALSIYLPFSSWVDLIKGVPLKSFVVGICFLVLWYVVWKRKLQALYGIAATLILVRLAFNWFVIPQRIEDQLVYPRLAEQIRDIVKEQPLQILASYPAGFYDPITFPLELKRHEILTMASDLQPEHYYLMDDAYLDQFQQTALLTFPFDFADRNERYSGQLHLVQAH